VAGSSYAVVVGVENYQNREINPVRFAENDARAFKDLLMQGLGVTDLELRIDHQLLSAGSAMSCRIARVSSGATTGSISSTRAMGCSPTARTGS